jgi:3D (Asp-Asp-Asp) domain-containing protein
MRAKVLPLAKRAGLAGVGIALADVAISEWGRRIDQKGPDMFKALKAAQGAKPLGLDLFGGETSLFGVKGPNLLGDKLLNDSEQAARKLAPALQAIADGARSISPHRARELRDELAKMDGLSTPVRRQINNLIDTAETRFKDGREATAHWNHAVADMVRDSQGKFAGMRTNVQFNTKLIREALKDNSGAGRRALSNNMDGILDVIRRTMRRGGKVTQEGMGLIKQLFISELRLYGLSPSQALASANVRTGEVPGDRRRQDQQRGGILELAKGALVPGVGSGDKVPLHVGGKLVAMVESGELVSVANRKATAALMDVNQAVPRFAGGGIAGMVSAANKLDAAQFPYVWGGGHSGSPAPFGPMDCSGAVSYVLQHGGVKIPTMVSGALAGAGFPGPGKVTVFANAGHTFMRIGNRYFGTSGSNPGGGAGWFPAPGAGYLSGFAQRHFKVGAGGGLVPRVMVGGPDSALKATVQAVLNKTRSGANRRLNALSSMSIGRGDAGDSGAFGKFLSSAYGPPWGGIQGTGVTATGIDLRGNPARHLVAVDPSVIALHSKLKIWPNPFGYRGAFAAEDTGGAIKGNRIDFYDWLGRAHQQAWGMRNVDIAGFMRGGVAKLARGGRARRLPNRLRETLGGPYLQPPAEAWLDAVVSDLENKFNVRETIARVTTPLDFTDDLALYRDMESAWTGWFDVALRNRAPEAIVRVGALLESARDNIKQITDLAPTTDTLDTQRVGLLEQLLREANQRTAVSQAQYAVLRDMPAFGGAFQNGGVVPGPLGSPRVIVAHGGETVTPPGGVVVRIVVEDGAVDKRKIRAEVEQATRSMARTGGRGLPGRGGG